MDKRMLTTLMVSLLPVTASAHGAPTGFDLVLLFVIYLFPYIVGCLLVGKGRRWRFTLISLIIYLISYLGARISGGINDLWIVSMALPYSLLLLAVILRWKKAKPDVS